jgi:hypothetical protein
MTIRFGDLDGVEMILEIERSFAIELPEHEMADCHTFGDLFDCVAKRVAHGRDGICLSAQAFRRLRSALGDARLRPSARIAELAPGRSWRRWREELQAKSGLDLPVFETTPIWPVAYLIFVASLAMMTALPVAAHWLQMGHATPIAAPGRDVAVIFFVCAIAAVTLAFPLQRVNAEMTVADLVRAAAPANVGRLVHPGQAIRTADVATCLEALARAHGHCSGPIDRRTRFQHD